MDYKTENWRKKNLSTFYLLLENEYLCPMVPFPGGRSYVTRYEKRDRSGFFCWFSVFGMDCSRYECRVQWCKFERKISLRSQVIKVFLYPGRPLPWNNFWKNGRFYSTSCFVCIRPCTDWRHVTAIDLPRHATLPVVGKETSWKSSQKMVKNRRIISKVSLVLCM